MKWFLKHIVHLYLSILIILKWCEDSSIFSRYIYTAANGIALGPSSSIFGGIWRRLGGGPCGEVSQKNKTIVWFNQLYKLSQILNWFFLWISSVLLLPICIEVWLQLFFSFVQYVRFVFTFLHESPSHTALWAWPFSNIYQVKGFLGPSCCEKQVSNDNIWPLAISKYA